MFCPNCGNKINDGAAFCPHCGAKLGGFVPPEQTTPAAPATPAMPAAPVMADAPGKRKGKGALIGVIAALVLILAAAAVWFFLLGGRDVILGDGEETAQEENENGKKNDKESAYTSQEASLESQLTDTWSYTNEDYGVSIEAVFRSDGKGVIRYYRYEELHDDMDFTWSVDDDKVLTMDADGEIETLRYDKDKAREEPDGDDVYWYLDGGTLYLGGMAMTRGSASLIPEPVAQPLEDDHHAAWVAHGQYLLADGTENSWNGKDSDLYEASSLTPIALEDVKTIDSGLYNTLSGKDVKYLYRIDLIFGTNDAGWICNFLKDGKLYKANGSYAFKIAQCSYEMDGGSKVFFEDQWISDPRTANAESLTPDTLFMPVWQEEEDEYGFSWASNPVVTGGAGLYTLVIAQYDNASSASRPGYGIGLVRVVAQPGYDYEEIRAFVPAEHSYGIIGDFNDWSGDVAMEYLGDDTWGAEVDLKGGEHFKVRADGSWDYSWGDPSNDTGNFICQDDGTYYVTITFDGTDAHVDFFLN